VREIRDGFIAVVADTPRVPARVVERLPHFVLIAGDIVFARKRAVDRCAVVGDAEEGWLMGSDCIRVRLPSLVDPEFAGFWFRTPEIRRHLLERSVGSTSMVTLSQGTLDSIAIPFPPIDVQRGVVAQLRSVDEATMANQSALDAMTSVRSSLARVLLTGEVRVRPDPDQA
jgi:type I restriction enzyme S subunit